MQTQLNWPTNLDDKEFVKHYWQVRSLLLRGAMAPFENPLSPDELGGLATDEDIPSRLILKENDQAWHLRHGPFTESELSELPAENWSLLVSDVEKHLPDFREILKAFSFIPGWRIDDLMISYAPAGASVGAHIDNYDVFLLQAAGHREWSINENPEADRQYLPDQDIRILANFEADQTFVLEPGDILYLPPGVPHHGVSLDNDCMTWSIGFRAPSHRDVITRFAELLAADIPEQAFYSDPAFDEQEHPGEINAQAVRRMREVWNTYVHADEHTFARLAGLLVTGWEPGQESADPSEVAESSTLAEKTEDKLRQHPEWERSSHSKFAFINHNELTTLFVDGEAMTCELEIAHLLTDKHQFSNTELLQQLSKVENRELVQRLIADEKLRAVLDPA